MNAGSAISEPSVLTEVPDELKRLARFIMRGFYAIEHALIIDILVRNPIVKVGEGNYNVSQLLTNSSKFYENPNSIRCGKTLSLIFRCLKYRWRDEKV